MAEEQTPGIVDIQQQVENLKKTLGDLKHILDQLDTPRSVVCKIINNTDIKLVLAFQHHDHGGFATTPPIVIEPHSAGAFGSKSSSGALFTGTSGTVHYVGGGMLLQCDWNNPWLGSNSCEIKWKRDDFTGKDDDSGRYRTWNIAGSGDQDAEMLFAVSLVPEQYAWRFCRNCNVLYYDGYAHKGVCAKPPSFGSTLFEPAPVDPKLYTKKAPYALFEPGAVDPGKLVPGPSNPLWKRQHEAAGFIFILSHSYPPQPYQQPGWRFCHKCSALFFDGYIENGVCPNGGGHEAAGFQFILTNETPPPWGPGQQPAWRFCHKCFALFFDGYADNKGVCPNGGGHEAEGLHFILNHHV
jgi:hypothetical protein